MQNLIREAFLLESMCGDLLILQQFRAVCGQTATKRDCLPGTDGRKWQPIILKNDGMQFQTLTISLSDGIIGKNGKDRSNYE